MFQSVGLMFTLTVRNVCGVVDTYHLAVGGVPEDCYVLEKAPSLLRAAVALLLTIRPPVGTDSDGTYPITVVTIFLREIPLCNSSARAACQ